MPYTEEQILEARQRGYDECMKHQKPSPKTETFINMTEKRLELIDYRMKNIEESIKEIKDSLKKSDEKFDTMLEKMDARYASKATENAVNRIGWIVMSAVILAILGIVITK